MAVLSSESLYSTLNWDVKCAKMKTKEDMDRGYERYNDRAFFESSHFNGAFRDGRTSDKMEPAPWPLFAALLCRLHDFLDANGEAIVDHHDFAACKGDALHQQIDRFGDGAVQADDRTETHFENVADRDGGAAEPRP